MAVRPRIFSRLDNIGLSLIVATVVIMANNYFHPHQNPEWVLFTYIVTVVIIISIGMILYNGYEKEGKYQQRERLEVGD